MNSEDKESEVAQEENARKKRKSKVMKIIWLSLGFIGLGLGTLGVVLPVLPTVPFLLLAAIGFGNSSERLHRWFVGTKLYKNNLESYVKGQGMTWKVKLKVMITVTLLMGIGFFMMFRKQIYIPCIILGVVWLLHIVYFCFGVKTKKAVAASNTAVEEEKQEEQE